MRAFLLASSFILVAALTACGSGNGGGDAGGGGGNAGGGGDNAGGAGGQTSTTPGEDGGGGAACPPSVTNTSADFSFNAPTLLDGSIAASCTVTAAGATSRQIACPADAGQEHMIYLDVPEDWVLNAVPTTGTVFVHATLSQVPFGDVQQWFELRAGGDPAGPLLLAGIDAPTPVPADDAAADWFQPLTIDVGATACGEEPFWACERKRQIDVVIAPGADGAEEPVHLRGGDTADVGPLGGYAVTVGRAEEHMVILPTPDDCAPGDYPINQTALRVMVAAKPALGGE